MYLYTLAVVICVFLISILYSLKIKDFTNPLVIFNIPLVISYVIYYLIYEPNMSVSVETLTAFSVGIIFFQIGFFAFSWIPTKKNVLSENIHEMYMIQNNKILKLSLIIGFIGFFYDIFYFKNLGVSSLYGGGSFTSNIRENYVRSENIPFLVKYGKYFLLFTCLVILIEYLNGVKKVKRITLISIILFTILSSFMTLSRTDLMISVIPIIVIYLNSGGKGRKIGKYLFGGIVLVLLMAIITKIRTNSAGISSNTGFFSASNPIMQYFGKPLPTFDQWISMNANTGTRVASIEPLNKIISALGIATDDRTFAQIGQFNVYTFLKQPYLDGGIFLVGFWMLCIGIFVCIIYKKASSGSGVALLFYSIYCYALFMAFFAWQFTIMTFVYFLLFLMLVFPFRKQKRARV